MRKAALKPLLLIVLVLVGVATAVKAGLNYAFDDFKGHGETESWSLAEARERGVLVTELAAVPGELPVPGGQIRFGEVWVEERALTTHRFVWFPAERRVGGYRLQFTLAEGDDLSGVKALRVQLPSDPNESIVAMSSSRGPRVYFRKLDKPDVSGVRIVLDKSPGGHRPQVRFTPR